MGMPRVGDLEIGQDLQFERRSWMVQRVGWTIFALLLGAALLGLFGGAGPLEGATLGAGTGLQVEYSRFARHNGPIEMVIRLQPGLVRGDEARIWVDGRYVETVQVERIQPPPERVEAHPDRLTYVFALEQPGQGGTFAFHLLPRSVGSYPVRLGLQGGPEHRFTQLIYP